jgi:hypothetical protein
MNTVILKIWMRATPLMLLCGLMALSVSAMAQSEDRHCSCSNQTLSGDYGYAAEGLLSPGPGLPPELQFRSVGLSHFDGKGNFTGVEHTVVNGMSLEVEVPWTANSGTYMVNSDCTGKLVLNTPNAPAALNLFFVLVRQGREFHTVLDASAISSTWTKVGETRR